jgi:hypothetical protein
MSHALTSYCDIARQRVAKHILAATNTQATIEELKHLPLQARDNNRESIATTIHAETGC